ncbi:glycosyltransferase family 2 protein [Bradyrhizobium sp. CCGB12]|uniref:glycosyltransferase family 2 protein n=1 Tax=Bradyrhizobium sp. CCGB12 TaxID=2949632 RepID=UPI0020B1921F|nr:glycosyltransferase family 2 protein [Bradyrhizobium sp. CCGB12]MCP3390678.1 glycosyltransferase family 2 protein [Bradyrhizobium sp. CCGB12]
MALICGKSTDFMKTGGGAVISEVAVIIVGFRNSADIAACLHALSRVTSGPAFDVFICENGGTDAFHRLMADLLDEEGPCCRREPSGVSIDLAAGRFTWVERLGFREGAPNVWIGCASDNLGYAGGINAWLSQLSRMDGWRGIWILNPDTEPTELALAALYERAESGRKAMVGCTILDSDESEHVRFRGGLQWQKMAARDVAIGLGERLDVSYDIAAVERAMDSPSGASMYVTRWCIEAIGPMDESYFLFYEDLDWGIRAKHLGLGYARDSIVVHKRGTTTGSARSAAAIPKLSVYLQHRNGIRFVRRHFPWTLPLRVLMSLFHAARFLRRQAPRNCWAVLQGVLAGLRGETGRPSWHREGLASAAGVPSELGPA